MAGAALVRRVLWLACAGALLLGSAAVPAFASGGLVAAHGVPVVHPRHQAPPPAVRATRGHTFDTADPADDSEDGLDAQPGQPPAVTHPSLPSAPASWLAVPRRHDDSGFTSYLPSAPSSPRPPPAQSQR